MSKKPKRKTDKPWTRERVIALGSTTTIDIAAQVIGIGRTTAYTQVRAKRFPVPVRKVSEARFVVPVRGLLKFLDWDD